MLVSNFNFRFIDVITWIKSFHGSNHFITQRTHAYDKNVHRMGERDIYEELILTKQNVSCVKDHGTVSNFDSAFRNKLSDIFNGRRFLCDNAVCSTADSKTNVGWRT